MKMPVLAYIARCKVNGKPYFGITSFTLQRRMNAHLAQARNPQTRFHRALRKYGREGFEWSVVATAPTWEAACAIECSLIRQFDTTSPRHGYNTTDGGDGVRGPRVRRKSQKGRTFSEEHRQHLREAHKRRPPFSAESRAKMSASRLGRPMAFSEDALRRISAANKGKRRSLTARHSNAPVLTDDVRRSRVEAARALGKANKGKIRGPETRAKISRALIGRVVPEETREKMRLAALKRHQKE